MNLRGAGVLVTGAASGIGLACTHHLTAAGARVWGVDRDAEKLAGARQELSGDVAKRLLHCDVSVLADVEQMVAALFADGRGIDIVLNNAAILRDQTLVSRLGKRVKKHSIEDWSATIESNLTGTFLVAREVAARWLVERMRGLIINTSSVVRSGNAGQSAYAASKAAIDALTVTWARELSVYGIRVAAIAYGFAETGMTRGIPPIFREQIKSNSPAGRFGTTEELVRGVQFICENDYFVGKVLELDGGLRF